MVPYDLELATTFGTPVSGATLTCSMDWKGFERNTAVADICWPCRLQETMSTRLDAVQSYGLVAVADRFLLTWHENVWNGKALQHNPTDIGKYGRHIFQAFISSLGIGSVSYLRYIGRSLEVYGEWAENLDACWLQLLPIDRHGFWVLPCISCIMVLIGTTTWQMNHDEPLLLQITG